MQGLVQFSVGRMWADSCLLWSSTIYLQHSDTGEGCLLCSHHDHNFCASYDQHLATLTSHNFRFKKLLGNLVLRLLSLTSVLVFRNCYTFLILLG